MIRKIFLIRGVKNQIRCISANVTNRKNDDWHFPYEEGHVVDSPYEPRPVPNIPLDQFVWKDMNKWSNHTAIVSKFYSHLFTIFFIYLYCYYRNVASQAVVTLILNYAIAQHPSL